MKTIKKISLLLLLSISFVGCDKVKDLLTLNIDDVDMTQTTEISVAGSTSAAPARVAAASTAFTKTATVQLSQNEDIKKYLDNIKSITLNTVMCKVTGVNNGVVQSLSLTAANVTKSLSPITVGVDMPVSFTNAELIQIASSLLTNQKLDLVLNGTVSQAPVTFSITTTLNADFVVKVVK